MSIDVTNAHFDVVIVAGPGITHWPSVGVATLSRLCSKMGLKAGIFGGEDIRVQGVLPLPSTGALVVVTDVQARVHRIRSRAVVRVVHPERNPDPFAGARTAGVIPLETAELLLDRSLVQWRPSVAILGTGNPALRLGSRLLEQGTEEVICVESFMNWKGKRYAGWEVERRRFEMLGGRIIEGKILSCIEKEGARWELKLQDEHGTRILDVARVVSSGPFIDDYGAVESPAGSNLYELTQSSAPARPDDVEGWALEEEHATWLAGKIGRSLSSLSGKGRERMDQLYRRARSRIKRYQNHFEEPFTPGYEGKWLDRETLKKIQTFEGVPQERFRSQWVASLECFENIPCNECERACPEEAIEIRREPAGERSFLIESKCTGCGVCVAACPSQAAVMIRDRSDQTYSQLAVAWRNERDLKPSDLVTLVNRKGDSLGSARVTEVLPGEHSTEVRVEFPNHLLWQARNIQLGRSSAIEEHYLPEEVRKVEMMIDSERRLVREGIPISTALFELGQARAGDVLLCSDESCRRCEISIDGVTKLACREITRKGMAIRLKKSEPSPPNETYLCDCERITVDEVVSRIQQSGLKTPEAVLAATRVGSGKCHGRLCMGTFKKLLREQGIDTRVWADWRFPSTEWVVTPGSQD